MHVFLTQWIQWTLVHTCYTYFHCTHIYGSTVALYIVYWTSRYAGPCRTKPFFVIMSMFTPVVLYKICCTGQGWHLSYCKKFRFTLLHFYTYHIVNISTIYVSAFTRGALYKHFLNKCPRWHVQYSTNIVCLGVYGGTCRTVQVFIEQGATSIAYPLENFVRTGLGRAPCTDVFCSARRMFGILGGFKVHYVLYTYCK